jgi:hypothetical protein
MRSLTRRLGLAVAVLGLVAGAAGHAKADLNLVLNGGFETGDFTDWALTGNPGFISIRSPAHSGSFAASFGAIGSPTFLAPSQNLTTTAGHQYSISFWLENDGGPANLFSASFGGDTLLSLSDQSPFSYTQFTFTDTATSSSTPLQFAFQQNPSFWLFDDVSVTDITANITAAAAAPEPSTIAYTATGVLTLALLAWRKRHRPGVTA